MMPATTKTACFALCLLLIAGALAACGKKGRPVPPESEEARYSYPQQYPAPSTVVPGPGGEPPERKSSIFLLPQPGEP